MDAYLLHRDSYRAGAASASAVFSPYASYPSASSSYRREPPPSYGLDRWSSLPLAAGDLASYPSYPRIPLDRLGTRLDGYQPEAFPPPRSYARPAQDFRPRYRGGDAGRPKKKPPPAQNLGPRKKPFKQTQGAKPAQKPPQKMPQKPPQGAKKAPKVEVKEDKVKENVEALAKETKELHTLWRTGVEAASPAKATPPTKKDSKIAGKKRKMEASKKEEERPKKEEGKPANSGQKKAKRFRNRKSQKNKKWAKKDAAESEKGDATNVDTETEKTFHVQLSDEEKQVALALQREACKKVKDFLGIPDVEEDTKTEKESKVEGESKVVEANEAPPVVDGEAEGEQKVEAETPEEMKEREEKAFEFFSKLLEENQELRQLYVEKWSGGVFECPACVSLKLKWIKKFRNVVSLVMHANKIMKTKKLPEHRGYARAVCAVLGWDPLKLPKLPRGRNGRPSEGDTTAATQEKAGLEGVSEDGKQSEVKVEKEGEPDPSDKGADETDEAEVTVVESAKDAAE